MEKRETMAPPISFDDFLNGESGFVIDTLEDLSFDRKENLDTLIAKTDHILTVFSAGYDIEEISFGKSSLQLNANDSVSWSPLQSKWKTLEKQGYTGVIVLGKWSAHTSIDNNETHIFNIKRDIENRYQFKHGKSPKSFPIVRTSSSMGRLSETEKNCFVVSIGLMLKPKYSRMKEWEFDVEVPDDTKFPINVNYIVAPSQKIVYVQEMEDIEKTVIDKSEIFFRQLKSKGSNFKFNYPETDPVISVSVHKSTFFAYKLTIEINENDKVVGCRLPDIQIRKDDLKSMLHKIENDDTNEIVDRLVDGECTLKYEFDDRKYDIDIIKGLTELSLDRKTEDTSENFK
jgi:hypothetical protein